MPALQALCLAAFAVTVTAHGYIDEVIANGKSYGGFNPSIEPWLPDQESVTWPNTAHNLGFVAPDGLSTPDIACHLNARNAKLSAEVTAGSEVTLSWTPWPPSHHGPVMDYLAKCNGPCAEADKSELEFFKIAELGQLRLGAGGGEAGYWAADQLLDNDNTWTVKIPESIAPGEYVLRHEILALHSAYDQGGAQFYPQCLNLKISGQGQAVPEGVLAAELYTKDSPSVVYNIYNDETRPEYKIPGPPLFQD